MLMSSAPGVGTRTSLKQCADCERELTRREFSIKNWRSTCSRCTACTTSVTAHPRLQAILLENHARVVTAALDEVGLSDAESAHFRRVWDEMMEAKGTLKLDAIMCAVIVRLMAPGKDSSCAIIGKDKRESSRRVWCIANHNLSALLRPMNPAKRVEERDDEPQDAAWCIGMHACVHACACLCICMPMCI